MRAYSPATRASLRRAVWASVAVHLVAAGALVALLRATERVRAPQETAISTRAPEVRLHFTEDAGSVEVTAPPAPAAPAPPQPANTSAEAPAPKTVPETVPTKPTPAPVTAPEVAALPAGPFAPSPPPRTLPPELVALLRKPGASSSGSPAPRPDPNVRPAGGTGAAPASAIHGALKPGQTAVYVLDSSGSMGAAGKFDAARAALVATLRAQPATVRFQVIVYDGTAQPLLASDGTAPSATEANVRAVAAKLAALEPRGKSNHLAALRAALGFRPDVIVLLTDADDLTAAALRPAQAGGAKPVPLRVAVVTAAGVQPPGEPK